MNNQFIKIPNCKYLSIWKTDQRSGPVPASLVDAQYESLVFDGGFIVWEICLWITTTQILIRSETSKNIKSRFS